MTTKKQLKEENERLIAIIEVQQDTINQLVTKLCTPVIWNPVTTVSGGTSASITWVYPTKTNEWKITCGEVE